MMWQLMMLICTCFTLFILGIFLMFYKRNRGLVTNSESDTLAYVNNMKVSETAKTVHFKEITKKTEKKFTKKWFLEYWHGDRSACYAWWTWSVGIAALVKLVLFLMFSILLLFVNLSTNAINHEPATLNTLGNNLLFIAMEMLFLAYFIMASVILWRCAKNSTRFWLFFARFWAILVVVVGIINLQLLS